MFLVTPNYSSNNIYICSFEWYHSFDQYSLKHNHHTHHYLRMLSACGAGGGRGRLSCELQLAGARFTLHSAVNGKAV